MDYTNHIKQSKKNNAVIIVEGYIDVIMLHQYGITNVVATMGTSINTEHIKILFRACDNIYFCFDGDNAGKNAASRALEQIINYITDIKTAKFVFLPEEHDPDSFIRKYNKSNFIKYIDSNAQTLSNYLFNKLIHGINIKTEEGRAKFISLIKPYIDAIKAPAMQIMLKAKLAEYVQLNPNILDSILNNKTRYAFYNSKWQKANTEILPKMIVPIPHIYDILNIINSVLNNISLLNNYKLPTKINNYGGEIKELIFILDYINHNYTQDDNIGWEELINIDIAIDKYPLLLTKFKQLPENLTIFDEINFIDMLNNLLGGNKTKIKIPKIKMKE